MWIERRATLRCRSAPAARRAIERETGARLPGAFGAGVVFGHEFRISVFESAVGRFVLDPKVRQRQMAVDHRKVVRLGERQPIRLHVGLIGPILAVEEGLILSLSS